jgi:putative cytosolic thioredoxin peroxidase
MSNHCQAMLKQTNTVLCPQIGKPAPDFSSTAVVNGQFKKVSLSDYKGKYLVLFFYPLDL